MAIVAAAVAAVWLADVRILAAVALAVCLVVAWVGAWYTGRRLDRRQSYAVVTAVASVLVFAVAAATIVARPLPSDPRADQPSAAPEDVRYWDLTTGSQLAYRHLRATGAARPTPVIFVGGGPGEAVVNNPAKADPYRELTRLGYDVYLYDQIGAGLSARLSNPADYTVDRHVADLEAIRRALGADQLTLIGASWGGSLVASYLAAHPTRVAKAVLTSPAPMDYARWPDAGDIAAHLPDAQRQRAEDLMPGNPRFITWYGLGIVNPVAAHNFIPDDEADAFFDTFLNIVRPATVCDPDNLSDVYETGNGLYANVFTTRDAASGAQSHVQAQLETSPTPAMIITGECNYIPWAPTAEYATTLPNATLLCLPNAGHAVELDRPDLYRRVVQDFLLDQPPAIPATPPTQPCTSEVVPG
ncbi:alpha/beta hydrolase [Mycolicibacterium elephantis]|uniref:alpha/beta hydrolase n=1 Tax=Mycolicibacterium elephantis TaxID=81858 RepID=UPI0013E2E7A8|nr:alpha/beta hydrolase [Mycolicibacterium elephantis]MCV7219652.1 alpha/beta hydrolase [Mycolicibacterium elephantis]